jgi:hypothetical protein
MARRGCKNENNIEIQSTVIVDKPDLQKTLVSG